MKALIEERDADVEESPVAAKKFRVQLDFEGTDMETINNLVKELELGTRAELFRSGLRAIRWMVSKKKQGCTIVAISPDERYFEPEFEFLDAVSSNSREEDDHRLRQPALV
jgi:hypothetical protein